uniref:Abasic site processing protein HMCES n=1 Tax=Culicoides sonorensis TaxID=179676 RepID=A0A336MIK4_CULSO
MCGRTCLTLAPDEICSACGKNGKKLEWRSEFNLGRQYQGHIDNKGYNTSPQDITPVLVSSDHFTDDSDNSDKKEFEPVVVPMLWGIIPKYHKGDYRKHGLTTNNCRLEGLQNSKIYKPLMKSGQRCVVLCEGFYEWQTVTGAKSSERKVYYIYFPQDKGIKIEDKSTWNDIVPDFLMCGMMRMGIQCNTIITFESDKTLAWLHHRTPAVLETDQQVEDWLDFKRVPEAEALKLLKPPKNIVWYQVSNLVNNSRNKSDSCNKPMSAEKTPKSKMMQNWLKKASPKKEISPKKEVKSPKKEEISPKKEETPNSNGKRLNEEKKSDQSPKKSKRE